MKYRFLPTTDWWLVAQSQETQIRQLGNHPLLKIKMLETTDQLLLVTISMKHHVTTATYIFPHHTFARVLSLIRDFEILEMAGFAAAGFPLLRLVLAVLAALAWLCLAPALLNMPMMVGIYRFVHKLSYPLTNQ